jgi:hypothetical protein
MAPGLILSGVSVALLRKGAKSQESMESGASGRTRECGLDWWASIDGAAHEQTRLIDRVMKQVCVILGDADPRLVGLAGPHQQISNPGHSKL